MNQVQLASPLGYRIDTDGAASNIMSSNVMNSIGSLVCGKTHLPFIENCISNVKKFLNSGERSVVAELPYQRAIPNPLLSDETPFAIDATNLEQIPFTEQHPVALKDLTASIQQFLSILRIPITNELQDTLVMATMGASSSSGELLEQRRSKPKHKSATPKLKMKTQIIRDAVHDMIKFSADERGSTMTKIINTSIYQRLKKIRQLGFSYMVYPGATHSRFEHSLGVFHMTCELLEVLEEKLGDEFDPKRAEVAMFAALLHDIGHGPFSHTFEQVGKELNLIFAKHETVSDEIIRKSVIADLLNEHRKGLAAKTADMISEEFPTDIYSEIVSSQFDADRLDYLQRDQLMTGSQNSGIDLKWLFENLEVKLVSVELEPGRIEEVETFVFKSKAQAAVQTYLLGLYNLYPAVYFHKVTRAAEQTFKHLMLRIHKLVQLGELDKIGLSFTHPIIRFFQNPNQIEYVLKLNDFVILGALEELVDSGDEKISKLATMLNDRHLPKALDVREKVKEYFQRDEFNSLTKIKRRKFIDESVGLFEKRMITYSKKNVVEDNFWFDSGTRVAYKSVSKNPGKLDSIQILENGKIFGIEEHSVAIGVSEVYKFDRVYIPFEDPEFLNYLDSLITTCCKEVFQYGLSSKQSN